MVPEVRKEVNRIAGSSDKLGDKRIGKSGTTKFIEEVLEIDVDEATKRFKKDAKRRALRAAGEILTAFINVMFNSSGLQGGSPGNVIRRTESVSYRNYNAMSGGNVQTVPRSAKYSFPDLVYSDWDDAEDLRKTLLNVIARDGKVSVTKLYDIIDDPSNLTPTDSMIGWTDLTDAYVGMEDGHYRLFLPQVVSIN